MEELRREVRRIIRLSDDELTEALARAVAAEREDLARVLIDLGEFWSRRLSDRKGYPSLFEYCTRKLGYSSSGAGRRIAAARVARRYRSALALLRNGELSLVGLAMLEPHLDKGNYRRLLRQARGKSQDRIAELVASIAPQARRRDVVRVVAAPAEPEPAPASAQAPSGGPEAPAAEGLLFGAEDRAEPVAARLYRLSVDLSDETYRWLRRAQDLVRHRFPGQELDPVMRLAFQRLVESEDRAFKATWDDFAQASARGKGRYITEAVKRLVWTRDGGCCRYVGSDGVRCGSRAWLEFDHIRPFALGGSNDAANLRLLCRTHNQLLARRIFGEFPAAREGEAQ